MHRTALLFGGFFRQILGGKRRARQAIAAGGRSDVIHRVADAFGRATGDLFVAQHAQAERVHQRIPFVAFVEIDFARDGRDAKTIAVMRNAGHHASEEAPVIGDL